MSKSTKRLSLKSETLRTLASAELDHVAGGAAAAATTVGPITSGITRQITKITTTVGPISSTCPTLRCLGGK